MKGQIKQLTMPHDTGYKMLFSHPELVRDLVKGFVHGDWVSDIDFSTLEMFPGSFVTEDFRERHDDRIWRVRFRDDWVYLYLILEFQSSDDYFMGVRIQVYTGLCYQDIINSEQLKRGDLLPILLPIVLYNGKRRWKSPLNVRELVVEAPEGLKKYVPDITYYLIDEGSIAKSELGSARQNLAAFLIEIEQCRNPSEIREVVGRLKKTVESDEYASVRRSFSRWLGRLLGNRFSREPIKELNDLREVDAMLAETIDEWVEQWKMEGIKEGLKEGKLEGKLEGKQERSLEIVLRLHSFGSDPEFIARVVDMPIEVVRGIISSHSG